MANNNPYSAYPNNLEASSSYYQPRARSLPQYGNLSKVGATPSGGFAQIKSPSAGVGTTKQPGSMEAGGGGGDWAGAATGALGLGADIYGMSQQGFNFGDITPSQTDYNSAPTYTGGQLYNEVSGAKPQGASGGEILSGAAQGAKIGTSIAPGIGTAIGAVGGALASVVGGAIRKNKQDTEKNRKMTQLRKSQEAFNQQDESYRSRQNQLYDYMNRNNAQGREYNIYKTRMV